MGTLSPLLREIAVFAKDLRKRRKGKELLTRSLEKPVEIMQQASAPCGFDRCKNKLQQHSLPGISSAMR